MVDDTSNMSDTPIVIDQFPIYRTGVYKRLVDSKSIPNFDPESSGTDKWLAARVTIAGTSPSITYGAWIGKSVSA